MACCALQQTAASRAASGQIRASGRAFAVIVAAPYAAAAWQPLWRRFAEGVTENLYLPNYLPLSLTRSTQVGGRATLSVFPSAGCGW